ncbi:UDP-N-acetylmuramate--L-alanine ligase [Thermomicrobiaceae bacterium CFH 74404]|uniref:UDP-N-acetylmuramate--L-alanine ligase n=1 Tax=Thermalbibacter longus TaxID=2951981 RepID=A0AA41WBW4_9BACT|nr:UDP-N-acetylmuramate--L-alanine ligase [Thermalbibacter longus]MCM8749032.1 UDP-N-acetylmuramate--L-alanine ligase [Thermalbibacter longus]
MMLRWPPNLAHLQPPAHVHFIGLGGIGMSGLARMLAQLGYRVSGCDAADSPLLETLRAEGIIVHLGHDPAHVQDADLVVITSAVHAAHPEVTAAVTRRRPVVKRAALLGWLTAGTTCVAVAGTHGKSTTAGMISLILERAGLSPSFAVGAEVRDLGANARLGSGAAFVVEADEYDYSFLHLEPEVAVVLNIEHDHPDLFPTQAAVEAAFRRFLERVRPGGSVVLSRDDPGGRRLAHALARCEVRTVTFGTSELADWRVTGEVNPVLAGPGGRSWNLGLRVPGWHNRLNAAAAVAAAAALGVDPETSLRALEAFSGVGRRFELWGQGQGIAVIVDYAHHPSEIRATIAAARERYPDARLWVIFQPHTYSRTRAFFSDFAAALGLADQTILTPVYAAREADPGDVSLERLALRIEPGPARLAASPQAAAELVAELAGPGDVVLVLGAGDVWKAAPALLEYLGGSA